MNMICDPKELGKREIFKFYMPIAVLFVSLLVIVNIITQKVVPVGGKLLLTAGDFIYPLSYVLSVVLTEVYGYALSRRVIWMAFICNIFITLLVYGAISLPPATVWTEQAQFAAVLGRMPRIVLSSLTAFIVGEFIGTYILARLKVFTVGKYLWLRTISATMVGQAVDTILFTVIAFSGILFWRDTWVMIFSEYGCKVFYQVALTPGVYMLARYLKRCERIDIFDKNTNFNPFHLRLD